MRKHGLRAVEFVHSLQRRRGLGDEHRLPARRVHVCVADVVEFERTQACGVEHEARLGVRGQQLRDGRHASALELDALTQGLGL